MARSRTRKQLNRKRLKRFTCAWRTDGGKAALAALEEVERVRHERALKRAGQFRRDDYGSSSAYPARSVVGWNTNRSNTWNDPAPARHDPATLRLLDFLRKTTAKPSVRPRTASSARY